MQQFSGVTNKLLDLKNNIDLATGDDHNQKDQFRFTEEKTIPFEYFEKQIKHNFVSI